MNLKKSVSLTSLLVSLALCLIFCFTPLFPIVKAQEGMVPPTQGTMRMVHLRMTGDELTPISIMNRETPAKKTVPNGYEPRGYIKKIGGLVWKHVGEWSLRDISDIITVGKPIKFILWVSSSGSPSNGDFRFTLKYGAETVAGPIEEYISGVDQEGNKMEVITDQANVTVTGGGEDLILIIEGKVNGDGMSIEYGNPQRNSGVSFMSDPVHYESISASISGVEVVFKDVFHAPMNNLFPVLLIDGNLVDEEEAKFIERSRSQCGKNRFKWSRSQLHDYLTIGYHTFEVGMAYERQDINNSWSVQRSIEVEPLREKRFLEKLEFGDAVVFFILVLIVIIYFIYSFSYVKKRSTHKNRYARVSPVPGGYGIIAARKEERRKKLWEMTNKKLAKNKEKVTNVNKKPASRALFKKK